MAPPQRAALPPLPGSRPASWQPSLRLPITHTIARRSVLAHPRLESLVLESGRTTRLRIQAPQLTSIR